MPILLIKSVIGAAISLGGDRVAFGQGLLTAFAALIGDFGRLAVDISVMQAQLPLGLVASRPVWRAF